MPYLRKPLGAFLLCGIVSCFQNSALAQITPDNTLGSEASRVTTNVLINGGLANRIDGGAIRDINLFHSFSEFNINDGQRVYFANPSGVQNILTRVTGGNGSNIFGTLGVDGNANLFLVNPNGMLFGENSRLDVRGSFVGTTANGLQFGEQGFFNATNPQEVPLLTVNPSALFYNQINPDAGIVNNSVAPVGTNPGGFDVFGLRVPDGKSLLLVGGNVNLDNGQLNAYGGRVELGGLSAPGSINLLFEGDNLKLGFPDNVARADVSLTNNANVLLTEGSVTVNARNLNILGSVIVSRGSLEAVNSKAGNIEINATDITTIDGTASITNSSAIFSGLADGSGSAGDITINTGSLAVTNGVIGSLTNGEGNAGDVNITAKGKFSLTTGGITSIVASSDGVNGANVSIGAQEISIADSAIITSSTGKGSSGNIQIKVDDSVFVTGSSTISSDTFGKGNAGNIHIEAGNLVSFDGVGSNDRIRQVSTRVNPLIVSTPKFTGERIGGDINIKTGSLVMKDAKLETSTYGKGNAGNVQLTATDAISLAGNAYILSTVEAGGDGKGGNIDINAATLTLRDSAQLLTITRGASDTQPAGKGDAGNINVKVSGAVDIAGKRNTFPSGLRSNVGTGTEGNGGNITVDAGSFNLGEGGQLSASTYGKGNAGNIQIRAKEAVSLTDAEILSTVEAGGEGEGGNIDINAATLTLRDSAQLLTITRGASDTQPAGKGDAGNINVKVSGAVDIAGKRNTFPSAIFSYIDTDTEGNAGSITIDSGSLLLQDDARLQASTFGIGNAGNIKVTTKDTVSLRGNAYILSTVEVGGEGQGGDIDINAATLSLTDGAQLLTLIRGASETDTQPGGRGDAGNVNVKVTGLVDVAGKKNDFYSGIYSVADTGTDGNAGNITINSGSFFLRDGALINARTKTDDRGGSITVNTGKFEALNGGQLIAITSGNGNAGNITINASEKTTISGSDPNNNRLIQFPDYVVLVGVNSGLFVNSSGSGDTGDIEVNSPKITLDNQGQLNANSASGNGGNIDLNTDLLLLRRGGQISTNAGTNQQGGDGGNINLDSTFIVSIPKENSDITANAFTGKGGNIDIKTQGIFGIEPRSQASDFTNDITASSELGVQGEIAITEPDVDPAQGTIELPTGLEDQSDQIGAACPRNFAEAEKISSFTVTGRGNLPPSILEPLGGSNDIPNLVTLPNDGTTQTQTSAPANQQSSYQPNQPIQEAQGWVKHPNGKIELVATNSLSGFTGTQNRVVCPK